MNRLIEWDTEAFCWINSHNCSALDWIMWTLSQPWSWAIGIMILFCTLTLRYERKNWWVVILAIMACFLFSDKISVLAFKETFHRLRPCHVIENVNMFRTTCGGRYGFVSSHAANIASVATFFIMRYCSARKGSISIARHRWILATAIILWVIAICYSRPYLGKHYPGDVICGAFVGMAIGLLVWGITKLIARAITKKSEVRFE